MQTAPVCVVIPTHNRRNLVTRAVDSVLNQTRTPAEIVVVDDHSTDGTTDVLAQYGSRIRVIRTSENMERGAARNLGAAGASAPWLAFLDSDDEWEPAKLERQLAYATRDPTAAFVTGIRYMSLDGRFTGRTYVPPPAASARLLLQNCFLGSGSSLLLPRAAFARVGGYPEPRAVQGSEDWLLLVALRAAGVPLRIVPEPLVRVRIHATNTTGDPARIERSLWSAVQWLSDHGFVRGRRRRRLRGRTAGVIARVHAAQRGWRRSARWAGRAVSSGAVYESGRACLLLAATAGRALLRGRPPRSRAAPSVRRT